MSEPLFKFNSYKAFKKALINNKEMFFNLQQSMLEDVDEDINIKKSDLERLMRFLRKWKNLSNLNK